MDFLTDPKMIRGFHNKPQSFAHKNVFTSREDSHIGRYG
jgi:hypothetical protein